MGTVAHRTLPGNMLRRSGDTMTGHLTLANNVFLRGRQTDDTIRNLLGMAADDEPDLGVAGVHLNILSQLGADLVLANNVALAGEDTGAVARNLAILNGSNEVMYGTTARIMRFRHNGTMTSNDGGGEMPVHRDDNHPAVVKVVKAADQTVNNSTTKVNDNHLLFAVTANEEWYFVINGILDSSAVADWEGQISLPAGAVVDGLYYCGGLTPGSFSEATVIDIPGTGTPTPFVIIAVARIGGTAGNVQLQWAQNVAQASDTKLLAGSSLIAFQLDT